MWTLVSSARKHGYDVRKEAQGWTIGKLSINGWTWTDRAYKTKQAALNAAFINFKA